MRFKAVHGLEHKFIQVVDSVLVGGKCLLICLIFIFIQVGLHSWQNVLPEVTVKRKIDYELRQAKHAFDEEFVIFFAVPRCCVKACPIDNFRCSFAFVDEVQPELVRTHAAA